MMGAVLHHCTLSTSYQSFLLQLVRLERMSKIPKKTSDSVQGHSKETNTSVIGSGKQHRKGVHCGPKRGVFGPNGESFRPKTSAENPLFRSDNPPLFGRKPPFFGRKPPFSGGVFEKAAPKTPPFRSENPPFRTEATNTYHTHGVVL